MSIDTNHNKLNNEPDKMDEGDDIQDNDDE